MQALPERQPVDPRAATVVVVAVVSTVVTTVSVGRRRTAGASLAWLSTLQRAKRWSHGGVAPSTP